MTIMVCCNASTAPADLRRLSRAELDVLARELREFVLQTVSQTGGHLSATWARWS
jgi:deoxyxylulose-5-phosphate synthase